MDIETAKILVSTALVVAVVIFSLVSFEMGFSHIVRDLRAGRKARVSAESRQAE